MAKIIKEIIIILLVCLIAMLALAVVLYDYIPNRKVVSEVTQYETSQEIETQLADDIDSEEKEVVLTYEVTSQDLDSYEVKNEYIPGKANPFAAVTQTIEDNDDTNSKGSNKDTDSSNESSKDTVADNTGIK